LLEIRLASEISAASLALNEHLRIAEDGSGVLAVLGAKVFCFGTSSQLSGNIVPSELKSQS
jgi:hypothetical protein